MSRHQRMMRNGWMIPHSLEWLFWPWGTEDRIQTEQTQESLRLRFKMTNQAEFMVILERLRVVKST